MTENDVNEEPVPPPPPQIDNSWQKNLKRAVPYAAGLAAFLIGILLFAPLEAYTHLALRQMSASGWHIDVEELSLSIFGRFKAQSVKIPFGEGEKQGLLKIAEAKGRIGFFDAMFGDKYDGTAEALILSFSKGDFLLRIDTLELVSALEQVKSGGTTKMLNGTISLQAESAEIKYKETKYLKEEIVVPFLKIALKGHAQQNVITVEVGEAMGRLVNAQIKGSLTLGQPGEINLNVILKPTNEFYEKYQDKDPRTLLKFAGILQDDGRIEFNIRGSMAQPLVEAVTAKAPGAGAAPPAPPPGPPR